MLAAYAFRRLGVVLSDIYFLDEDADEANAGAEQGLRLEFRFVESLPLRGSKYSATPIELGRPIWRADLLEQASNPGSFDRTHHHPRFTGWEPGRRRFVPELSADPLGWLEQRLLDPRPVLEDAGIAPDEIDDDDLAELRRVVPEIMAMSKTILDRIGAGELGQAPDDPVTDARVSWL